MSSSLPDRRAPSGRRAARDSAREPRSRRRPPALAGRSGDRPTPAVARRSPPGTPAPGRTAPRAAASVSSSPPTHPTVTSTPRRSGPPAIPLPAPVVPTAAQPQAGHADDDRGHRPPPNLDPMPPPHHDPSHRVARPPRSPSASAPPAPEPALPPPHFTALVRRFAADSPDEWGWGGGRGRATSSGRVGERAAGRRRGWDGPRIDVTPCWQHEFSPGLRRTAGWYGALSHPSRWGRRSPAHACTTRRIAAALAAVDERRPVPGRSAGGGAPVRRADPARPAPSAARGAARRSSTPSSRRGCANGATRSTRPRRSTTASGRPSRPGGVGVHLVPVGRRWHPRW